MPTGTPSQNFVAIEHIRDGIIALKDGGLRTVLMCSSLNFALKSSEEQEATIFQYQDFLNSLDFPLEFVVHSRRLNIAPYLDTLNERQKEENNELMKIQINEYVEFIKTFVEMTNIMAKTFYVVVPYSGAALEKTGIFKNATSLFGTSKGKTPVGQESFEEGKNQLWQRVEAAVTGLQRVGIRAAPLNTEETIELFYGLYNPTEFERLAAPAAES